MRGSCPLATFIFLRQVSVALPLHTLALLAPVASGGEAWQRARHKASAAAAAAASTVESPKDSAAPSTAPSSASDAAALAAAVRSVVASHNFIHHAAALKAAPLAQCFLGGASAPASAPAGAGGLDPVACGSLAVALGLVLGDLDGLDGWAHKCTDAFQVSLAPSLPPTLHHPARNARALAVPCADSAAPRACSAPSDRRPCVRPFL